MRRLVIGLALIGAALAVVDHLEWRRSHERLLALAESSSPAHRQLEIGRELRRRTSPSRAAAWLAWRLLDLEVDRGWLAELSEAERQTETARGAERLRLAGRLAAEVLPRSPASWRALVTLGASRFLLAGRQGRRDRPASDWRVPLLAAMRLAPSYPEPPLFLAAAELSRWSGLSSAERRRALPVLAKAFAEPRGLDLLLSTWVRVAPSLAMLLEPIPDRAPAWQRLGEEFRRGGDLERFATAHQRWLESLPAFFGERVGEARARLRAGSRGPAYDLLRSVIAAPHDAALAEAFSAAMALYGSEEPNLRTLDQMRRWLRWALDLCVLERCPLAGETLGLLAGHIPDLAAADRALAALADNQPDGARRLEPANGAAPEWDRYWIHKARRLAGQDPAAARRALARVAAPEHQGPRYRLAELAIAEATGDAEATARARGSLAELELPGWPCERWTPHGRSFRLEIVAAASRGGLCVEIGETPPGGAALELRWDGRLVDVAALPRRGSRCWRFPVEPGIHMVEMATLTGRPLCPLRLGLEPSPPAG